MFHACHHEPDPALCCSLQIYLVIYFTPIGIASLIAKTILSACAIGHLIQALALYLGTVLAGFAIHGFIVLPLILLGLARVNPLKTIRWVLVPYPCQYSAGVKDVHPVGQLAKLPTGKEHFLLGLSNSTDCIAILPKLLKLFPLEQCHVYQVDLKVQDIFVWVISDRQDHLLVSVS